VNGGYAIHDLEPQLPRIICGGSAGKCESVMATVYRDHGGRLFLAYIRGEWQPPTEPVVIRAGSVRRYTWSPDNYAPVHEYFYEPGAPAAYGGLWCRGHRFQCLDRHELIDAIAKKKRVIRTRPQRHAITL
jgi:hypothetical protein